MLQAAFSPTMSSLSRGAEMVHELGRRGRIDTQTLSEIDLAVSEALTNVIRHSGATGETGLFLSLRISEGVLEIEVQDNGPGFDFESVPPPDFENHPAGGYGLFIIKSIMDQVEYWREPGRNVLRMGKTIGDRPS